MRTIKMLLAGATGLAGLAAAGPASAQYYQSYGYAQPYSYAQSYGYNGYNYGVNTAVAQQQCTAAVQNRLYNRTSLGSILGSLIGIPANQGRVVGITSIQPRSYGSVRVNGIASSGRYGYNANPYGAYGAYGYGAYGSLGYNTAAMADLSFRCDVDARGYVRNVSVWRR